MHNIVVRPLQLLLVHDGTNSVGSLVLYQASVSRTALGLGQHTTHETLLRHCHKQTIGPLTGMPASDRAACLQQVTCQVLNPIGGVLPSPLLRLTAGEHHETTIHRTAQLRNGPRL
eukprot:GHRQ01017594.1.p1 GENE.GHRQ01017594.1~~GHRQ01017594.1.p1  ORF type:complete len:116 (-),score=0.12 GHRQ01017594.1:97-444(-)